MYNSQTRRFVFGAKEAAFACYHWLANPWNYSITTCLWNGLLAAGKLCSFVSKGRLAAIE